MRLVIDGWSRSESPWTLIKHDFDQTKVVEESKRSYSDIRLSRLAAGEGGVELRTRVTIKTSGDFDCKVKFSKEEVLLMASQVLRDLPFPEAVRALADVAREAKADG